MSLAAAALLLAQSVTAQDQWPTAAWPVSTLEAVGLDSQALAELDSDIAAGRYGYVDSMLVIRGGQLVYDRSYRHDYDRIYGDDGAAPGPAHFRGPPGPYNYFDPWWHPFYRRGDLHTLQSVTKSVTSVLIGIALARGEFPGLDTPVLKFFDVAGVANVDDRKRRMTIRHLLTMTTGLAWNEDLPYADPGNTAVALEASCDWVGFTIDQPMAREPGTAFQYNSGAPQLLAHIFWKATGLDLEEYAQQHLFAPLGIGQWYWKRTPSGLVDATGGLYLQPRDLAKIAYLLLRDGVWDGERLVSPDWVSASLAPGSEVSGRGAGVSYGYLWWLYPYGEDGSNMAWGGSGFGGQRPIVLPEYDLIVVFTGWNVLPDQPALTPQAAIERIRAAMLVQHAAEAERTATDR